MNVMEYKKCTVAGIAYSLEYPENGPMGPDLMKNLSSVGI